MINLQNVVKTYHMGDNEISILKGVDVHIKRGELVAIIGPSGSGKTSLMNIIGLLDRATHGTYSFNGKDVAKLNNDELAMLRNRSIGFVFQLYFLLPRLSALQNVGLPLTYRDLNSHEINQKALESLEKVGVSALAHRKPSEMSGGQQQRIAIARALVGDPNIILADEPTGALDSKTGQDIMNLLIELNAREQRTIIVVTHDPHIAKQCKRIIQIADGEIVR